MASLVYHNFGSKLNPTIRKQPPNFKMTALSFIVLVWVFPYLPIIYSFSVDNSDFASFWKFFKAFWA